MKLIVRGCFDPDEIEGIVLKEIARCESIGLEILEMEIIETCPGDINVRCQYNLMPPI